MVAQVARQSTGVLRGYASGGVERVADERESGRCKVDANLVRPARCNSDLKQRTVLSPLKDADIAVRRFPVGGCGMDGLQYPVWNRTDRSVYVKFIAGRAPGSQSAIDL
jgi:hypothetical protein